MAKSKNKQEGQISSLNLFNEEEPVDANQVKDRIKDKEEEQEAEPAAPKKRGRKKKTESPSAAAEVPEPQNPEQPADTGLVKQQIEAKQEEPHEEPALPKKRGRKKKTEDTSVTAQVPEPKNPEQPSTSVASLPTDKAPIPQLPTDPKQNEEKEAQLKEKYKKQQEERLAALKRVRANK